jgi:hypothetical protein
MRVQLLLRIVQHRPDSHGEVPPGAVADGPPDNISQRLYLPITSWRGLFFMHLWVCESRVRLIILGEIEALAF